MMDSLNAELESALSDFTPFDKIADEMFSMDEDDELRMSLISQGRKYNQAHGQSAEASEIEKVFTKQEIALNQLIQDVDKDISAIERDLNQMRMARVRSPKGLSDLVSAKGSLHNTKLSAIKEINSMKRNIIDLNMKAKKGTLKMSPKQILPLVWHCNRSSVVTLVIRSQIQNFEIMLEDPFQNLIFQTMNLVRLKILEKWMQSVNTKQMNPKEIYTSNMRTSEFNYMPKLMTRIKLFLL